MSTPPDQATVTTDATDPESVELLTQLLRRVTVSLDLTQTLQVVARAVVERLGFSAAVVNVVRAGGMCEVAAVAGPEEAAEALLGTRAPVATFLKILDACEPWG